MWLPPLGAPAPPPNPGNAPVPHLDRAELNGRLEYPAVPHNALCAAAPAASLGNTANPPDSPVAPCALAKSPYLIFPGLLFRNERDPGYHPSLFFCAASKLV